MLLTVTGNVKAKKNNKRIAYRGTGYKKTPFIMTEKTTNDYMQSAITQMREQFAGYKITDYPISISVVFYYQTRHRKDIDNSLSTIADCMVHAGVLEDDDVAHVNHWDIRFGGYDKENPRVEIHLQD